MRRATTALLLAFAIVLPTATARAHFPPDRTISVSKGQGGSTWDGVQAVGLNANYFGLAGGDAVVPPGTCSRAILTRCETILFELSNPLTAEEIAAGKTFKNATATVTISDYQPFPASDFDLRAFASDATGTPYDQIGQSGANPGEPETISASVKTTITQPKAYVLVHVVYFAVPNSFYKGTLTF
jgi:hypothetical protein